MEMPIEEFSAKFIRPAVDDLWRRVQSGQPITPYEAALIRSLGRESASWALNIEEVKA
jgi:hypothetical protein